MIRAALLVVVAASLAACVSADESQRPKPELTGVKTSVESPDSKERRLTYAQTLVELDQRVDRYVLLGSQGGPEARAERTLLASTLSSQVSLYREELLRTAADEDPTERQHRRTAVKALAFSGDPRATKVLVNALSVTGDARLLTNATYALGKLRDPHTPVEPLIALIKDPDHDIRSNALLALWHVFDARRDAGAAPAELAGQHEALTVIEGALFDPADPLVRAHAAAALGALGDRRAVDPLMNLLRDEHPLVRTQTAIALAKLGDEKAIPALVKVIDKTPAGTPKQAVITSLTLLLEKRGLKVPETLGDQEPAWERYVRESIKPEK